MAVAAYGVSACEQELSENVSVKLFLNVVGEGGRDNFVLTSDSGHDVVDLITYHILDALALLPPGSQSELTLEALSSYLRPLVHPSLWVSTLHLHDDVLNMKRTLKVRANVSTEGLYEIIEEKASTGDGFEARLQTALDFFTHAEKRFVDRFTDPGESTSQKISVRRTRPTASPQVENWTICTSPPEIPQLGDYWYDSATSCCYIWNGFTWCRSVKAPPLSSPQHLTSSEQ